MSGLSWYGPDGYSGIPGYGAGDTCFYDYPAAFVVGYASDITDRENVANFHFGIPRHDGQRDDVQLLWSASAMNTIFYSSPNDMGANNGANLNQVNLAVAGGPYCPPTPTASTSPYCGSVAAGNYFSFPGITYPSYIDAPGTYNLPFGTQVCTGTSASSFSCLPTETYLQPSSTQNRAALSPLPNGLRDSFRNDTGIVKAQWTHPLSSNAYVRLFGYTFFSDWTQAGAVDTWSDYVNGFGGPTAGSEAANYDLITHTAGGELQFADQLSPQHLLQFTTNYTTANVMRFNNSGWVTNYFYQLFGQGGSPIGLISEDSSGTYHCYDPTTGSEEPCKPGGSWEVRGPYPSGFPGAGTNAGNAGAKWVTLWNGDASGPRNTVTPKFTFASLEDEFRPTDKLLLNLGVRLDNYQYDMGTPVNGTDFYAQIIKNDLCVNGAGTVYTSPLKPGQPPPAKPIYTQTCPAGYAHPNFTTSAVNSYTLRSLSPRFGLTYTQSPDTVWRASVGRFTEPPISASVQYLGAAGDATSVWAATLPLGFLSPFHPIPQMSATQADISFEHQFHGTDMAIKISPFLNLTQGYQVQSFIGPNFVTQAPVGQFRSDGVEFAFTKGDFNRNGLSGEISATFTDAKMQYQNKYFGVNQINTANTTIAQYNSLTSACGSNAAPAGVANGAMFQNSNGAWCIAGETPASACYLAGAPSACNAAPAVIGGQTFYPVANPYYNKPAQGLLDPNAWYAPGDVGLSPTNNPSTTYYDSPFNGALILNYRHDKFAITPSFQLTAGTSYGGPMDLVGLDPRTCTANSAAATRPGFDANGNPIDIPVTPITSVSPNTNPNQCDYLTSGTNGATYAQSPMLYIPNPVTGTFSKPGQFRNPWAFLANVQLSYDISPKVSATLTLANIYHHCFGGSSEPWTKGWSAPSNYVCGYDAPGANYVSNFYNGTSPTDKAANGTTPYNWQMTPYIPSSGNDAAYAPAPFNAYLQLQIKL
jgi:hypothetical protein